MKLLAAAGLVALALAGFALAAVPNTSVSSVVVGTTANGGRTITVSGTRLGQVTSILLGTRTVRFVVVSPRRIVVHVPPRLRFLRIQFTFQGIDHTWTSCNNCSDQWSASG